LARYAIEFTGAAARDLRKIGKGDRGTARRLVTAIEALGEEPRPDGVRKLAGEIDVYRIRVGDYRVLYGVGDAVLIVTIVRIGHRRDVYEER
jgi:mRNA interferase RelE/StbE